MEIKLKADNRGGYRPGSGRKPIGTTPLSQIQVKRMLRKGRKWAREHGKDVDDWLLTVIYGADTKDSDRIAAIKLWKDHTTVKISEGGAADKALGPAIFLPEQHPALTAVQGGKSAA